VNRQGGLSCSWKSFYDRVNRGSLKASAAPEMGAECASTQSIELDPEYPPQSSLTRPAISPVEHTQGTNDDSNWFNICWSPIHVDPSCEASCAIRLTNAAPRKNNNQVNLQKYSLRRRRRRRRSLPWRRWRRGLAGRRRSGSAGRSGTVGICTSGNLVALLRVVLSVLGLLLALPGFELGRVDVIAIRGPEKS
jgi:hypothetical protein